LFASLNIPVEHTIILFVLFPCRVRTKFSVVDDDGEGQFMRARSRPRKLGQSSQKAESGKEWKPSKSTSHRQNIDTGLFQSSTYQNENVGHITPLPPPLVSIKEESTRSLSDRQTKSLYQSRLLPLYCKRLCDYLNVFSKEIISESSM